MDYEKEFEIIAEKFWHCALYVWLYRTSVGKYIATAPDYTVMLCSTLLRREALINWVCMICGAYERAHEEAREEG